MRILLVTYWGLTNLGGIWTYMKQLSDKLAQQGHEVTLMGSHVDSNTLYLLDRDAYFDKKAYYSSLLPYLDPLQFPHLHQEHGIFSFELGRYVFEGGAAALGLEQYDVIHAQDPISAYALRRVMKKAVPLVASMHGAIARESYYEYRGLEPGLTREEYEKRPIWSYFRRMEQLAVHAADLILVSSKWIGQVVGGHGVMPDRIHIQPYGVNLKEYEAKALMPSPLKRRQGKKLIMYAGRLEYIKGVHILIHALGLLQQRRRDWTCIIAGSGSLLEELKLQAQALGVQDDVEFAGTIDNIPAALTSADIYVQPSLQDTQPFSVTEAQLAGIAPVVAGTTGMPEMVQHGVTGWIVPADNAAALVGQLELLLRDDSLRARAGIAAQRWAQANRSLDAMAEGTLKVYRRAAGMHGWPQRSRPAVQSGHLIQGAFHPADLLNVITPGNPLESVLRSRLPADYRIPDANILPG
ncbi:glycosyltransferase family 4 protein [Paenibacillus typhae]|uniref:glycosyltransferase family 4 protein n=1 Tax=Paenibacillus typhae TaxID=1174501 RepID=UPI001C8E30C5|nr:glycosyltransferase family 4 protein [Paenibacillus typhae]MBY0014730.1 glycosyltransferase family 4 protein [Paenibacillus typhae]